MQGAGETPSDVALLERTCRGERAAFTTFVQRHRTGVFRYARSLCANPDQAEDVLQETFIQALRGAGGFRGGSARSWLLTIARRASFRLSRLRAGEPAVHESLDVLGVRAGWGDASATDALSRGVEQRELLTKAFEQLEPLDREVLIACDLEGLSAKEAGAMLELSVAALKSRLHRARLRLVAVLRSLAGNDV